WGGRCDRSGLDSRANLARMRSLHLATGLLALLSAGMAQLTNPERQGIPLEHGSDATFSLEDQTRLLYELYPYPPPTATTADAPALVRGLSASDREVYDALASELAGLLDLELHPELTLASPSHLAQINHFLFQGRRDFCRPFRVL